MTAVPAHVPDSFQPNHQAAVVVDSDGTVLDTMEVKQKKCFHPEMIRQWDWQAIAPYVRETAQFVTLYSKTRGINRFQAFLRIADLLRNHPDVVASGVSIPQLDLLRRFVESGVALSSDTLAAEVERAGDDELARVLAWSTAIDRLVEEISADVHVLGGAKAALEQIRAAADIVVLSSTPTGILTREWARNGLADLPRCILGPEFGRKHEVLALLAERFYAPDKVLMVGDAPADLDAARKAGTRFYPILPGKEVDAWEQFSRSTYGHFLAGTYAGEEERRLIKVFEACLPAEPPWLK